MDRGDHTRLANLLSSSPKTILMKDGEVVVLLAGRPDDASYGESLRELESSMADVGGKFSFSKRQLENRRGGYLAISTGVSMGCGSQVRNAGRPGGFVY